MSGRFPRWRSAFALACLAGLAAMPSALAVDPPPGEFRAAPSGTRLTYSDFSCSVQNSPELTFECATSPEGDVGRGHLAIVGYAAVTGGITPVGFMRPLQSANIHVKSLILAPQARSTIATLWPLEVGKTAAFDLEADITHQTSGYFGQDKKCVCTLHATARVTGTSTVQLSHENLLVYVIETTTASFTIPGAGISALKWTSWYAPDLGAPVKARTEWTQGPLIGLVGESELWRAERPGG